MLFRSHVPRAPLCEFVSDFWLYESYEGAHPRELIVPSGTFEMVFNLQEDELRIYSPAEPDKCRRFSGALVSGPYSRPFMSDAAEERAILGVHFKPGGAAAVLGMPASEFRDVHVDLKTLWGPAADVLRERLCVLREPSDRFALLEQALMQRLVSNPAGHGAVRAGLDMLMRTRGRAKTRDIAKAVDLSQRRFISLFANEVGLTPKLFGRIQRIQRAVGRSMDASDWAQLAVECGYFDQSHLIRDFTAFVGLSPADYRRRELQLSRTGVHTKRHHLPFAGEVNLFQ
jgi:AraC-like DNA-binding protein